MTRAELEAKMQQYAAERHNAIMGATDALQAVAYYHQLSGRIAELQEILKLLPTEAPKEE